LDPARAGMSATRLSLVSGISSPYTIPGSMVM